MLESLPSMHSYLRYLLILNFSLLLFLSPLHNQVSAQDDGTTATDETTSTEQTDTSGDVTGVDVPDQPVGLTNSYESRRYFVETDLAVSEAKDLSLQLEALFDTYNNYLRFDPKALPGKLNVKLFPSKDAFDAYFSSVVTTTPPPTDDYVYIHFPTVSKRELLVYKLADGTILAPNLAHHAFIQFLKAFVQNPPLWIRDGFAVYFETAEYVPEALGVAFPENLAWLDTTKKFLKAKSLLPLERIFKLNSEDLRTSIAVAESWAFISFLINSTDRFYSRLLWDSIRAMRSDASQEENEDAVQKIFSSWYGIYDTQNTFFSYILKRKTFLDYINDGITAYAKRDWVNAVQIFTQASSIDPDSFVPYYYFGLIYYAQNDFMQAEVNLRKASELNGDPTAINYARGLNAFAMGRLDLARTYLDAAREAFASNPNRADGIDYGKKIDDFVRRRGL